MRCLGQVLFLVILVLPVSADKGGIRLGYLLGFSTNALPASSIDSRFQNLPALGHFSAFFAEGSLGGG